MKAALIGSTFVVLLASAAPAMAQQDDADWTGPYIGGSLGHGWVTDDSDETVVADTNGDGRYGDTVSTVGGGNALTASCGGTAVAANQNTCTDHAGTDWTVNLGYDVQLGSSFVFGVVAEYGRPQVRDGVSAFDNSNFYSLERKVDDLAAVRARAGFSLGHTLVYATGGTAYAKVKNRFTTSNNTNTFFTTNDGADDWGYRVGGGVEQKIGKFTVGAQYLYTSLNDNDYTVHAGGSMVPLTNPFIINNADGTDLRRSDNRFAWHSVAVTASLHF